MSLYLSAIALALTLIGGFGITEFALAQDAGLSNQDELKPIVKVKPIYPQAAVEQRITGHVIVEFMIDENGIPQDINVIGSSDSLLEHAAVEAIRKWKYLPFASGAVIRETIEFSMGDPEEELPI
jgi:TonB family protein